MIHLASRLTVAPCIAAETVSPGKLQWPAADKLSRATVPLLQVSSHGRHSCIRLKRQRSGCQQTDSLARGCTRFMQRRCSGPPGSGTSRGHSSRDRPSRSRWRGAAGRGRSSCWPPPSAVGGTRARGSPRCVHATSTPAWRTGPTSSPSPALGLRCVLSFGDSADSTFWVLGERSGKGEAKRASPRDERIKAHPCQRRCRMFMSDGSVLSWVGFSLLLFQEAVRELDESFSELNHRVQTLSGVIILAGEKL